MLTLPSLLRVSLFALFLLVTITQLDAKKRVKHTLRRWESTGIVNCTAFEFSCKSDKSHILPLAKRCDGVAQCKDKSDEHKCTECRTPYSVNGTDGFLQCLTAEAMRMEDKAWKEYRDGMYPKCPKDSARDVLKKRMREGCLDTELRCAKEKTCLQQRSVCDGVKDCGEPRVWQDRWYSEYRVYYETSEDESDCKECHGGAMLCPNQSKCVPPAKICDGVDDCWTLGLYDADEKNCTTEQRCATCSGDRALCGSGQCIAANKVCDGVIDCSDASDEQNCPTSCGAVVTNKTELPTFVTIDEERYYLDSEVCKGLAPYDFDASKQCPPGECDCRFAFECNGKCLPKAKVCDGKKDCSWYYTSEEETNCLKACLKAPFFTRVNKLVAKCIEQEHVCDGVYDFADGSDEKKCSKCPSDAHKCDGGCLPSYMRCDGNKDCKDGSDEKNCTCEECIKGRMDTYSCEATGKCMKRSAACGPHSLCPQATARDELFCVRQSRRKGSRYWD